MCPWNPRFIQSTAPVSPSRHDSCRSPLDANAGAHDIALRDKPGVATQSIGEGPTRHVVVLPRNV
jgi:hypothetical protein